MTSESEPLASAQKRITELEARISVHAERHRQQIEDLESQLDQARINDEDLKGQLERSRINTEDVLRQLEASRTERLHLVERLSAGAASHGGIWHQILGRRPGSVDPIPPEIARTRRKISRRHLRGSGLEIGALHSPMSVKRNVNVKYVDRFGTIDLRREYPEWDHSSFVEVDLIDDGEILAKVENESQDFIIASHMLEHCENPLGTLRCHLTKLKPGAVLFYIVPDRRGCFDADRPLTSFEHILRDDREGPEGSRWDHYLEFSKLANKSPEDQVESIAKQMMEAKSSIHFHVWEDSTFRIFLERANENLDQGFSVEHCELNHAEIIAVLRKAGA